MNNSGHVICVEDNEDFSFFMERAFDAACADVKLSVYDYGMKAVEFFRGATLSENKPSLIILDINLPDINGFEILKTVRETNKLKKVPVLMLSSSERNADMETARKYGADAYAVKPGSYKDIRSLFAHICNWMLVGGEMLPLNVNRL